MRIVVVHNYYGSSAPSGENVAVETEIGMLRRAGHDVHTFIRRSDEIRSQGWRGLVRGGLAVTWNPFEAVRIRRFLRKTKPDVVHVHNTFPLISPSIFWIIREFAASVLTLHNYRLFCASALLLRDGVVCTKCLDESSVLPALKFGCYRSSRFATFPIAQSIALHRAIGTWTSRVDAFIAVSEFQRTTLINAGLPAARLHVKPNFFGGSRQVLPWQERNDVAVFVGRLTQEKGVEHLIRGWLQIGANAPRLRIIGEGPLRASLEQLAKSRGPTNIEFLGGVSSDVVIREVSVAKLMIVPSIWYEGFPIVLLEAFAAGTPCAVSNMGSLPTIVQDGVNGLIFEANDPTAIAQLMERIWRNQPLLARLSTGARASLDANYTEEINHRRLMDIYGTALSQRGLRTA
jgi:glycosyltransferase involved in cell wall biosynthesis